MKIVDAHAHIGPFPTLKQSEADLLSQMESHGVSYALVSNGYAEEFPEEFAGKDQLSALMEAVAFAKKHPDRIGVLCWIRPNQEELSEELKAYIEENLDLIHGFKFHPYASRLAFDDPKLVPYLEYAMKLDLPFLVHTAVDELSSIGHLVTVCKKYPDLKVCAAHLELFTDNEYALERLKENPNLYGDTAWVSIHHLVAYKELIGQGKIFFGTDIPVDEDIYGEKIYREYFENKIGLEEEDYAKLMQLNAEAFYRL